MIADEREKAREASTRIKLALVTHDPAKFLPLLFGDAMTQPTTKSVPTPVTDFDASDTAGEWQFPQRIDPAEAESILAEMLAESRGVLTGDDVGEWQ